MLVLFRGGEGIWVKGFIGFRCFYCVILGSYFWVFGGLIFCGRFVVFLVYKIRNGIVILLVLEGFWE